MIEISLPLHEKFSQPMDYDSYEDDDTVEADPYYSSEEYIASSEIDSSEIVSSEIIDYKKVCSSLV